MLSLSFSNIEIGVAMQVIEIINQARAITNEQGQFTNEELVGFLNKCISEMNNILLVNFPLIKQPYNSRLADRIQDISITIPDKGVVFPYSKFGDDLQNNIMVNYIAYSMLLAKKDDYAMFYKNSFDLFVESLVNNFEFDYTNKFKSRLRKLNLRSPYRSKYGID